ncbi:hypothetical protein L1987_01133 [Smallanthus sonchifolius]|uniref:Uncharacterized protein n=1 Tax=Smallanthus sonchifolius TaxID=185202 RepID=A0ACB9K433_9ASTR|nr:hypothetical protein L1987_01133 [Smallanthus sonchifolius]
MGDDETGKKKRVAVESLGWLTESSIMPKKHRAIAGVGPSSILELKAQLYKSQEEAKSSNSNDQLEFHRAKKKITPNDPFADKNSGVDARSHKDKLEMKAEKDGTASYAALEKKAELYEKLARGEVSDEEDKEKYCVDFFSKTLVKDESLQPQRHNSFSVELNKPESDTYDEPALPDTRAMGLGRAAGTVDNDEHKRFVREVHEEVNQAREKVSELKVRRQEQVAARREKLKQAYLRKQLEKLKAQSKQGNNNST